MYQISVTSDLKSDLRSDVNKPSATKVADLRFSNKIQREALLISTRQQRAQGKLANIISSWFIYLVCFLLAAQHAKVKEGQNIWLYFEWDRKKGKKIRQTLVIQRAEAGDHKEFRNRNSHDIPDTGTLEYTFHFSLVVIFWITRILSCGDCWQCKRWHSSLVLTHLSFWL